MSCTIDLVYIKNREIEREKKNSTLAHQQQQEKKRNNNGHIFNNLTRCVSREENAQQTTDRIETINTTA